MKKIINSIVLIFLVICTVACEKEVTLDLNTASPRLVVNAPLKWYKGTAGNHQIIKLTLTAGYYENSVPTVRGASVQVINESGTIFNFNEVNEPGVYECFNFIPELNHEYELVIEYNNETYIGNEILYSVVNFDATSQSRDGGLDGNDYQVKAYFTDPVGIQNYYLTEKKSSAELLPVYSSFSDNFFDGNQVFDLATNEDFQEGDIIEFSLYGISKSHQDYCKKLINSISGGPFQTTPGKIKGNIKNVSNPSNYPLGYFSLSEVSIINHQIN